MYFVVQLLRLYIIILWESMKLPILTQKEMQSTLIENISAFPDTAISGSILAFLDHI